MGVLLTAAQMRAMEGAAISSGRVTGLALMERAGRGVVEAIWAEWPGLRAAPFRAVVLCGPGNNGGDGYVIARLLAEAGAMVSVQALAPPATDDARAMAARWGGEVVTLDGLTGGALADCDLVVDALFGTGLSRPLAPGVRAAIAMARALVPRLVAVDVPSGLCADSGRELAEGDSAGAPADLTVTFERPRLGHHLAEGPRLCGRLAVVDLGLAGPLADLARRGDLVALDNARVADLAKGVGHKFSHGHALIVTGDQGRGGAARLAARGALRVGAGLVTLGPPPAAIAENAARLDAVMLRGVADGAALAGVLSDRRINALCLGPGMGTGAREAGLLATVLGLAGEVPPSPPHKEKGGRAGPPSRATAGREALSFPLSGRGERWDTAPGAGRALVLDADALTILSQDPALFAALPESCVLTPHAGEFARLFPDIAAKLAAPATKGPAYSKVDATLDAAARAGCVVLFKGPDTVIAAPSGSCAVNSAAYGRTAPWLATAGSGDVLAGFICGLLARGFAPFDAACTAAWLHVECARSFGPGLIAEDLPEELPKVLRALGA